MQLRNFYLGTHMTGWLGQTDYRLFVSHNQLKRRKTLYGTVDPWALDSGGFTVVNRDGAWLETPESYAAAVRRYSEEIGYLEWASPQDWMCEPQVLKKTGLTVAEHQYRTVTNFLELKMIAPDLPFIPVLQGFTVYEYLRCVDMYARHGVNLEDYCPVGVGSVCRRQSTSEIAEVFKSLQPLKMHGFGVKKSGLKLYGDLLHSSDSLAWSFAGRYDIPLPGHTHKNCANCMDYAEMWRDELIWDLEMEGFSW